MKRFRVFLCTLLSVLFLCPFAMAANYQGVDIAHYAYSVDFQQLKASGNGDFVYIKTSEGITWQDPKWQQFTAGAKAAGIPYGYYHYFHSSDSGVTQADVFWSLIKNTGYSIIPAVDVEETDGNDAPVIQQQLREFVDEFYKLSGEKPVIYASTDFINRFIGGGFTDCPLWVAHYDVSAPGSVPGWGTDYSVWQYSGDKEYVQGIDNPADLDLAANERIFLSGAPAVSSGSGAAPAYSAPVPDPVVLSRQQLLNRLHIKDFAGNGLTQDGVLGSHTTQAVRNFQSIMRITVDGQWGPQTQGAADAILAKPTIREGSRGAVVAYVQSQIGGVDADGVDGPQTNAHVGGWQVNHGLIGDGVAGPQTWQKLID